MIKKVMLGEEIVITTDNRVGLMAEIAEMMANLGVSIRAALGYRSDGSAKLMLVTDANLVVVSDLKKRGYKSVKETEVVLVELEDKPGALKIVTTELKNAGIDIDYMYITASTIPGGVSDVVMQTNNNEEALAILSKYV